MVLQPICGRALPFVQVLSVLLLALLSAVEAGEGTTIRVATFNGSCQRPSRGQLLQEASDTNSHHLHDVAQILRHIRPDVILLNEFDADDAGQALAMFQQNYLLRDDPSFHAPPLLYPFSFTAPVNTGVPSGRDLDHDGQSDGPGDAFGFGRFPGQYGMAVLSRFPIRRDQVRTFQTLLWKDVPEAALPVDPANRQPWYSEADLQVLRLSSKSHWDVPVDVGGKVLHVLASHPTPPVFDGPEDRNGKRNHDEIRFWKQYISGLPMPWLKDDRGISGSLEPAQPFVILGDQNADPHDGDSFEGAISQLLSHPRVNASFVPASDGAAAAATRQAGANLTHTGPPDHDTGDFPDGSVGNLRVDYVLPSRELRVTGGAVFWPRDGDLGSDWINCSDHRLVWLDLIVGDD